MSHPTPKLQVLISTINDNFTLLNNTTKTRHPELGYLIVHQHDNHLDNEEVRSLKAAFNQRGDIRIIDSNTSGLSKSRNICIENATSEIVLIADDDIEYPEGFVESILKTFDNQDYDVVSFTISGLDDVPFRPYRKSYFKHNLFSILSVASVEIAMRLKPIKENSILFDEQFGLGATYPISEEAIFLRDCLTENLTAVFIPKRIAIHAQESSGNDWRNERVWFSKGAVFRRMYGNYGVFFIFALGLKKRKFYKQHYSLLKFITNNLKSFIRYQRTGIDPIL